MAEKVKTPIVQVSDAGKAFIQQNNGSFEFQNIKPIWQSKTFWINVVALVALFAQQKWGIGIDESTQLQIVSGINILLRVVTKDAVSWK